MQKSGQGAIESQSAATAGTLRAQGATEYLVLLAVVLIVALVSVALLGFFPGMASDAQITQSKTYWQSASPIAIVEMVARYSDATSAKPYLRVRNNGAYPIRITKLLGGGQSISYYHNGSGAVLISDYYYLASGEEKYFARTSEYPELSLIRDIGFSTAPTGGSAHVLYGVQTVCTGTGAGMANVKDFGFEYIEYIDGQQITKREAGGKPLIIKCTG